MVTSESDRSTMPDSYRQFLPAVTARADLAAVTMSDTRKGTATSAARFVRLSVALHIDAQLRRVLRMACDPAGHSASGLLLFVGTLLLASIPKSNIRRTF